MNITLLIDAIVRQTTVLIAHLATSAGVRAPLAHVANQVFYGSLSTALEPRPSRGEVVNEVTDLAADGYLVTYGSSFIMAMEFADDGPRGEAILTYGQSDDPTSAHHVDQMKAFSAKQWRPILFTEEAIANDPALREYEVKGGAVTSEGED